MATGIMSITSIFRVENHEEWLNSTEQGSGTTLITIKNHSFCILNLRTTSRLHTDNDLIATLSAGYRPCQTIDVPCWINQTCGVSRLYNDGQVKTWVIPSSTTAVAGRVYIYAMYPLLKSS